MPIEVTYPGVYIAEMPQTQRGVAAVATNIAAFVGRTPVGPTDEPQTIFSFGDFQQQYGGLQFDYPVSYAVQDFFANGGSQAIVARLFEPNQGDGFARLVYPPSPPELPDNWLLNASAAKGATTLVVSRPTTGGGGEPDVGLKVYLNGDKRVSYLVTSYTMGDPSKKKPDQITIAPGIMYDYARCTQLDFVPGDAPSGWNATASGSTVNLYGGTGLPDLGDLVTIGNDTNSYPIIAEPKVTGTDPSNLQVTLQVYGKPAVTAGIATINTPTALPMPTGWQIEEFDPNSKSASQGTLQLINGAVLPMIGDQFTIGNDPTLYVVSGATLSKDGKTATVQFGSYTGDDLDPTDFCLCCAPIFARTTPLGVTIKSGAKLGDTKMVVNMPQQGTIDIGDTFTIDDGDLVYSVRFTDGQGTIYFLPEAPAAISSSSKITFYPTLALRAANQGDWGNLLFATVDTTGISDNSAKQFKKYEIDAVDLFNLTVELRDSLGRTVRSERYLNLAVKLEGKAAQFPNRLDWVLDNSSLVRVDRMSATPPSNGAVARGAGGNDGTYLDPLTYMGNQDTKTGMYQLEHADLFNLLCIPPDRRCLPEVPDSLQDLDPAVRDQAAMYATNRRAFYIVDPPVQWKNLAQQGRLSDIDPSQAGISGMNPLGIEVTRNCAVYFPRIIKEDLLMGGKPAVFAPCGAIAGIMAATDIGRGIWKAPAGQATGLSGVSSLEVNLTDQENGLLNPKGINCLRNFPIVGPVVWGARTLIGADQLQDAYKYIPVRRLTLFLEESLLRSTQWAVFEPNNEALWSSLRLGVGSFLAGLAKQGAFYSYKVICDASNNTPDTIADGKVIVDIGVAPVDPAEFVMLQITQLAPGAAAS